jgi:hypothetical protein
MVSVVFSSANRRERHGGASVSLLFLLTRPVRGVPREVHLPPGELRLVSPRQECDCQLGPRDGRGHLHADFHL